MTPQTWALLTNFISTVGFPVAITCYLLVIFRKSLDANTTATISLTTLIRIWIAEESRWELTEEGRQALLDLSED